jgi:4-hydroxybenzoate polyprenyltransferase
VIGGLARLSFRMLRYRIALMLWMFMLMGAAGSSTTNTRAVDWIAAVTLLGFSYIAATTLNDLADEDIDRINHPRDPGRPLVTGHASRREMLVIHLVSVAGTLVCGVILGPAGLAIAVVSLAIGHAYSAPPILLSYRTYLAPLVLSVAYVIVPFSLGMTLTGSHVDTRDVVLAPGLFLLFLSRINLKDFRDRAGDSRYGKPTLLLRFGKRATCMVSLVALIGGDLLVVLALGVPAPIATLVQVYVFGIIWMLRALWLADDPRSEQVAIGIGAKMGNGFLLCALAWLVLLRQGAETADAIAFVTALTVVYGVLFIRLTAEPGEVSIGYKG